ncbi:Uncharacterized protein GBIM_01307 [Gryllus bimaculatus]|nr:Uncharacterized protein GBIM_01307 [Gryllus bimaculatus]
MRVLLVCAVLCGGALADIGLVQRGSEPVPIIAQSNVPSVDGRFSWAFESADGTSANQEGSLEPAQGPQDEPAQTVRGQYSYRADDGREIVVRYVADRFGYRPESDVIAPAIVATAAEARNLPPLPLDARGRN